MLAHVRVARGPCARRTLSTGVGPSGSGNSPDRWWACAQRRGVCGPCRGNFLMHRITSDPRAGKVTDTKHQCFKNHTEAAKDCPLAASLNLAEIRSMIDLLRVATVLVSHCVRKHTRTSATQTSLRHPPSAPILSGLYVYNGRSDESGGYGTIPNAPSLTLAVGFRNENPPSNLHQHQCLQSLHTLITMRSCRGNFLR